MKTPDRVRAHTCEKTNAEIDEKGRRNVHAAAKGPARELSSRISKLDQEWDVERVLETNASILALTGTILGLTVNRKFFAIPCAVLAFLLQHALQGWCPPLPILRKFGIRTQREIDEEKYALKALRGDFGGASSASDPGEKASRSWNASKTL